MLYKTILYLYYIKKLLRPQRSGLSYDQLLNLLNSFEATYLPCCRPLIPNTKHLFIALCFFVLQVLKTIQIRPISILVFLLSLPNDLLLQPTSEALRYLSPKPTRPSVRSFGLPTKRSLCHLAFSFLPQALGTARLPWPATHHRQLSAHRALYPLPRANPPAETSLLRRPYTPATHRSSPDLSRLAPEVRLYWPASALSAL